MSAILIAINIIAGLFLIGVVLLQSGKGADMGAAFGGANSTMFGPAGPGNALTKATAGFAALFMGTSLALAAMSARQESVFDGTTDPVSTSAPAEGQGAVASPAIDPEAAAEAATAAAAGVAEAVEEGMASAAEAVQGAADSVGQTPGDATDQAASNAANAADSAGQAASDAMKAAGDAGEKAAGAVDEKAAEQ